MGSTDFKPSQIASAMQLRTRKENKFEDVEASLPDQTFPAPQVPVTQLSVGGILGRLGHYNPLAKNVTRDDIVWLFDNTAFRHSHLGPWQAEFVAAVFEREAKVKVVDMVTGILRAVGLADDAEDRKTVEERIMPFLWDLRMFRTVTVLHSGKSLKLGPTGTNGIANNVISIPSGHKGSFADVTAKTVDGATGILDMQTYYAGPEGWGIISDVDDTIKITATSSPVGILRETFINEPRPVPGMPELYANIKSMMAKDTAWFYLSASPYNLFPFLREFRDKFYPDGTLILRDASWRTLAGLLSTLTMGTEEYKVDRIKKINSWLPKRKMIVIGDSTQSDPEAYGEIYRTVPGWIKMILIRKATDIAEVGIEEKNQPERFEEAFRDIPRDAWHVFEDPDECVSVVRQVMKRN